MAIEDDDIPADAGGPQAAGPGTREQRQHAAATAELAADARRGLTASPKWLSPRWFYDARGSALFEQITELPEYYPTRTERGILAAHAAEIAAAAPVSTVIELGSGYSTKTTLLLDAWQAAGTLKQVVTVDVSGTALAAAAQPLRRRYPEADIRPVQMDFTAQLGSLDRCGRAGRTAVVFLGSTIGNLAPGERAVFLAAVRGVLDDGDVLLLGTDLVKPTEVLLPAYDDAGGVTAEFNRNVLRVLNRELDGDLPLDAFSHRAIWDADAEQIEMRLRADRALSARLERIGLDVGFERGEQLRTEISAKFRREGVTAELAAAGLTLTGWWTDPAGYFGVSLSS